jgi:radical SAM superfamily enzyme YgiQ (UPF0313 family)
MTDIVLVNPPLTGEERYGSLAGGGVYMPPLGLANLAAFIRQHGYSVKIIDCCVLNLTLTSLIKHILSDNPKYVGITAVTISINKAATLAKILKEQKPSLKIIVGGCHISALPEETMKGFSQFDIGVIGEGEFTAVELLQALEKKDSLDKVKGIIFRENGALKINEPRPLIENLDTLPFPAWDLLPDITKFYRPAGFGFKRLPVTSLLTLRGCPMRCTFCSEMPFAKTCRAYSPEYVIETMKFLKYHYGIKELMIYDGTFVINEQRLIRLCELMVKERLNLVWSCNGRINLMTREILKLMKHAGCWSIAYGIESGSQEILDFIQKDIDLAKVYQVLTWTKKEGILAKGYFMIGHLVENKESIRSTLNFILNSDLDLLTLTYFSPLPGTLDYTRANQYGRFNNNWDLLSFYNPVFIPKGLNKEMMHFYRQYIIKKFYLRPQIIFKYIKMFFNIQNFKIIFLSFLAFLNFAFLEKNTK